MTVCLLSMLELLSRKSSQSLQGMALWWWEGICLPLLLDWLAHCLHAKSSCLKWHCFLQCLSVVKNSWHIRTLSKWFFEVAITNRNKWLNQVYKGAPHCKNYRCQARASSLFTHESEMKMSKNIKRKWEGAWTFPMAGLYVLLMSVDKIVKKSPRLFKENFTTKTRVDCKINEQQKFHCMWVVHIPNRRPPPLFLCIISCLWPFSLAHQHECFPTRTFVHFD